MARLHHAKVKGALAQEWIARGRAPGAHDLILKGLRQGGEEARVSLEFELRCGRALRQTLHQGRGVDFAHIIALRLQRLRNHSHAGGGVEAHGVTGLPALVRIIGEDAGDAALCGFEATQLRPGAGEIGDKADAVRLRLVNDAGEIGIVRRRCLEGNRARHDAPVKLGQHHIHGEIDGGKAPARRLPLGAARG